MSPRWRSCAVSREHGSWMRRGAATTDCEPALRAPFSSSVTTRRPSRSMTRRSGMVTCSCMSRRACRTVVASRRCSSATTSTMWAISGQARSSSSPSPIPADPDPPGNGWSLQLARASRTSRRGRRMPVRRSSPRFTVSHGVTGAATDLCNHAWPPGLGAQRPGRWKETPARRTGRRGARWFSTT
jgi:hypothetical protein